MPIRRFCQGQREVPWDGPRVRFYLELPFSVLKYPSTSDL
jgi:hypothetical protein